MKIVFVILVEFCLTSTVGSECPSPWQSFKDHCYNVLIDRQVHWYMADEWCLVFHQSKLVEIESKEENDFVASLIPQGGRAWLGLTDWVFEGDWVYRTTGEPVQWSNWKAGEPDNNSSQEHKGDQDCAAVASDGTWEDLWCNRGGRYSVAGIVCEKNLADLADSANPGSDKEKSKTDGTEDQTNKEKGKKGKGKGKGKKGKGKKD